jgi:hypothetical protein
LQWPKGDADPGEPYRARPSPCAAKPPDDM